MTQEPDDWQLVKAFQNETADRRKAAFEELYERYSGDIWRFLTRLSDRKRASDLTQEVFVRVLNGLDEFEGKSSFRTWIFRIATNLWKDYLKKKRPVSGVVEEDQVQAHSPDDRVEQQEREEEVRKAVDTLSEKLKAAVVLVRFEGMKYEQAADALGINVGTLKSRITRAYDQIYDELKDRV